MGHGGLDFLGHLCQSQVPELVSVTLHRCDFFDRLCTPLTRVQNNNNIDDKCG